MKLRLQSNSIRLRLKRAEVARLSETGRIEEEVIIGGELGGAFTYVLEASPQTAAPEAQWQKSGLLVRVPRAAVDAWAHGDDVGIEASVFAGEGRRLQITIEKDFACIHGDPAQNLDTFPNPLEESPR